MKKTFEVKGMHCTACEELIKDALAELPGVKKVDVSSKTGKLVIDYDEKTLDEAKIKDAVKQEGYQVR